MERKIGEIFEHNGEWYQCVESSGCALCAFNETDCEDIDTGCCEVNTRSDRKSVIFKRLEKVGEPFTISGTLYQHYKVFDIDNVCGGGFWCVHNYNAKTLTIEIKQNKEDMKTVKISKDDLNFLVNKIRYGILPKHTTYDEITDEISNLFSVDDTKHSNSESIGKNLKPFSLEAAKSGKPVCTRDGRKVRIICFDAKDNLPIIALITNARGDESLARYKSNGRFINLNESDCDLMMLPEKKEGCVNLYRDEESKRVYCGEFIFSEREKAEKHYECNDTKVATVSIGWEE